MNTEIIQEILDQYGDRATNSIFERSFYTRDLAPVPELLVGPLFRTLPDIVIRPESTEEVAGIMKTAFKHNVPVTPRAGGSTVYFNSVPIHKGILMDLNVLKGVAAVDETAMTVTVKPATTWIELDRYLSTKGLAPKSFPSSTPAATIGGWFCMMGYGIGSLKYGSLLSQVRSIEVVTPEGEVLHLTKKTQPSLDWYAASEGTLGVVTQLEVEVRRRNDMKHFLLQFASPAELRTAMQAIIKAAEVPFNMHFTDQECLKGMNALGIAPGGLTEGYLLAVDYEGSEQELELAQTIIQSITEKTQSVTLLQNETAELEWEEKFKAMRLKRGGPSLLGAEIWLPIKNLPEYLADVQKMSRSYNLDLFSYGHVVTSEYATVMTTFNADELYTIRYIINLSLVKKLHDIGYHYGGCPYGIGLWNAPMVGRIHESSELNKLKKIKSDLDPKGIMNPGKVYRAPFILNPFNYTLAMDVLAGVRKVLGKGW
ncbi:FAD-binding oxidoreductase [Desulfitobacterium sp. AusDCA]|uniref:FAD-binding oxidoreductase n=1 Tax=Desulfitobacterium sp. AusDCA TaxID=3240383 RepID=UPI003DA719A0